ncbi:ATP-binding protein, partial [Nocardia aurea]
MGVESGPKARRLAEALAALRQAANNPTYKKIVDHCKLNHVKITDSTVSDWLNGESVPASAKSFELVVRYLNGRAARSDSGYECLSTRQWENLRTAAFEERRGTQGARAAPPRRGCRSDPRAELHASLYVVQVREFIAPVHGLQDRERELEMLAEFCHGDDESYLWVQGEPWAGKSALLSSFVLDPPPDVTVVSFFVTDRLAAQNNHTAFTAAVLDQLAGLLPDHKARIESAVINRDGLRNELLALASRRAAEAKQRLVLVVDGLDEDTGKPLIVGLLPVMPDENLRVVVASRYGPRLYIPHGHPLTSARRHRLAQSEHAAGIRDRAVAELDALLEGPDRNRELLALITTAQGLSISELEILTDRPPFEIDRLLRGTAGRSFRATHPTAESEHDHSPIYALAHETLQRTAETRLGTRMLSTSLDRLHSWADQHNEQNWPSSTPDFLLHRYFTVLERHHDLLRMMGLTLSSGRHRRLRASTGGDWAALTEISVVQQHICEQSEPDLLTTARLARRRDHLQNRNHHLPVGVVVVRAYLGQIERAEALARSIPAPGVRVNALAQLAEVVAQTDLDRAARLLYHAAGIVNDVTDPRWKTNAFDRAVKVIASIAPDRAELIANNLTDPQQRDHTLAYTAEVVTSIDPDRAEAIANNLTDPERRDYTLAHIAELIAPNYLDRAEAIADNLTNVQHRANTLARLAVALATINPAHADRLADRAVDFANDLTDSQQRVDTLEAVAAQVARIDPNRAKTIVSGIRRQGADVGYHLLRPGSKHHDFGPLRSFAHIPELIAAIDPGRAEAIANNLTDPEQRADTLARLANLFWPSDPGRADQLADQASEVATNIPDSWRPVLAHVAAVIGPIAPGRAETIANNLTDPQQRDSVLAHIATSIAPIAPARAETIANNLIDPRQRAEVLARIAELIAPTAPDRARSIVNRTAVPWQPSLSERDIAIVSADPDRTVTHTSEPRRHIDLLVEVAAMIASTDPDGAGQLVDRAETLTGQITDPSRRAHVLAGVVDVITAGDPDRAELIANQITVPWQRARAHARVVEVITVSDPDRAELIANQITVPWQRADALARIAGVVASIDRERALRLADHVTDSTKDITDPRWRADAVARILGTIASIDRERALRLADHVTDSINDITDGWLRADAVARIVGTIASIDRERALRFADHVTDSVNDITDGWWRADAVARIVRAISFIDPHRAANIAGEITDPRRRGEALAAVAGAIASTDRERALRFADHAAEVANDITDPRHQATTLVAVAGAITFTDRERALRFADHAAEVANDITDPRHQATTLV